MPLSGYIILPVAFICEFIDSTLGMGYGTTLTPLLILLGYDPLTIVPGILLSEFFSGIFAALLHHKHKNVNLRPHTREAKVALVLSCFSIVGACSASFVAISISKTLLKLLISLIVIGMAFFMIITHKRAPRFRWRKITTLGTIAAFNKGLSGGGYGPLVMGGQMLSGINTKSAVAITSLAEGITCLAGFIAYALLTRDLDLSLAPWLVTGAVLSVPCATHMVKRLPEKNLKWLVSLIILTLGLLSLIKVLLQIIR